jgi:hypothetical protein
MNIQTALLPHKHVPFSESLIGVAGFVRRRLIEPRSVDELWAMVESEATDWPSRPSFTQVILAVDVLFSIGQVRSAPDGRISAVKK